MAMALVMNGIGALAAFFLQSGAFSYPAPCDLKNAAFAFALYVILVYLFMFRQALSRMINLEIYELQDTNVIAFRSNANRTFENTKEQMPMFLSTLCVYTVIVNPARGAIICFAYCFFLAIYPTFHGRGQVLMISTFPRYILIHFMLWATIFAALDTHKLEPTPPSPAPVPPVPHYAHAAVGANNVYSNSKYLADLQHGMSLDKCTHYCSNWESVCQDVCESKKECGLSDRLNARHFTRENSCQKKCIGFNMHSADGHCTLFSDNLKLLKGGSGIFHGPRSYAP